MAEKEIKRLPQVKTLYEMLPKGAEGGKEFARIVDLLLFHEARRAGKKITLFSDSAGDYYGLDSFEGDVFRKHGTTGYQYKFYPSPLSDNHRIRTLITTYPGNTVVVTSRIVGYDSTFPFDNQEFAHCRLTKLQLPEIEQFIRDWYAVRIKNPKERDDHANGLIRILQEKEHEAIGELAQNPLLLTIIALVHRIDAVLPDERVVLYHKCTETLLNTWPN
jgi:hypothetical protein